MKIYVASSWRNSYQQFVVADLRQAGYEVYDFKHPAQGNAGFHWSEIDPNWQGWSTQQYREALKHEYAQFGFNRDFDAMKGADACVLVLPCGRSAHLEAGWMKGAGKKVVALIPPGCKIEPELMYNLLDGVAFDMPEVLAMLKTKYGERAELVEVRRRDLRAGGGELLHGDEALVGLARVLQVERGGLAEAGDGDEGGPEPPVVGDDELRGLRGVEVDGREEEAAHIHLVHGLEGDEQVLLVGGEGGAAVHLVDPAAHVVGAAAHLLFHRREAVAGARPRP